MATRPSALALNRDPSGRFMPWIIAALSLVVAVAIGAAFALAALTKTWSEIGDDRISIRFDNIGESADTVARQAAARLKTTAGVTEARLLTPDEVAGLLSPWLGDPAQRRDLPLPRIIEVRLLNPAAARAAEEAIGDLPGFVIDSTRSWLEPLRRLAVLSGVVAAALATLSILVIVLVTVFAVRGGLLVHAGTIELLRRIGAEEDYIAGQFQWRSLQQGLTGGLAGVIPGIAVVVAGIGAAGLHSSDLLAGLTPGLGGWLAMAVLPFLIALVAMLTSRYTVLRLLRDSW